MFIGIGILGGFFGALWNYLSVKLSKFRRKRINEKIYQLIEVIIIGVITVSIQYFSLIFRNYCKIIPENTELNDYYKQYTCQEGYYNQFATLIFSPLDNS